MALPIDVYLALIINSLFEQELIPVLHVSGSACLFDFSWLAAFYLITLHTYNLKVKLRSFLLAIITPKMHWLSITRNCLTKSVTGKEWNSLVESRSLSKQLSMPLCYDRSSTLLISYLLLKQMFVSILLLPTRKWGGTIVLYISG